MSERYRTAFGQRLFDARKAAKLTQLDVCERLGISQGTLSELERSGLSSGHVATLAALYGVNAEYLATGTIGIVREPSVDGVAQVVSHQASTVDPHKQWDDLVTNELPQRFTVAMPDSSMLPRIRAGDIITFSTSDRHRAGDAVLVHDGNLTMFVRVYRERRPGEWEAHALNDAYQPLESGRDKLVILAVLVGLQQRWG